MNKGIYFLPEKAKYCQLIGKKWEKTFPNIFPSANGGVLQNTHFIFIRTSFTSNIEAEISLKLKNVVKNICQAEIKKNENKNSRYLFIYLFV